MQAKPSKEPLKITPEQCSTYTFLNTCLEAHLAEKKAKHISTQDFIIAVGTYTTGRFGLLAKTMLKDLGITSSQDLGNHLQKLVQLQLMQLDPEDHIEDFSSEQHETMLASFFSPSLSIKYTPPDYWQWKDSLDRWKWKAGDFRIDYKLKFYIQHF